MQNNITPEDINEMLVNVNKFVNKTNHFMGGIYSAEQYNMDCEAAIESIRKIQKLNNNVIYNNNIIHRDAISMNNEKRGYSLYDLHANGC